MRTSPPIAAPAARSPPTAPADRPRLLLVGASGRLGRAVVAEAARSGDRIVAGVRARPDPSDGSLPAPIAGPDRLAELLADADVLVSASTPEAERRNLPVAAERGVPCVVATTGLGSPAPAWLEAVAREVPVVLEANYAMGVRALRRALRAIGPLPEGFDLSVIESHRRAKRDHPSGTAVRLVEELDGSGATGWAPASGRREPGVVEIASLRGGDTPGVHVVQIAGPHEMLRFEHVAFGREAFAAGMLAAARAVHRRRAALPPGLYSLDELLEGGGA